MKRLKEAIRPLYTFFILWSYRLIHQVLLIRIQRGWNIFRIMLLLLDVGILLVTVDSGCLGRALRVEELTAVGV
jgi:hypothetical protein